MGIMQGYNTMNAMGQIVLIAILGILATNLYKLVCKGASTKSIMIFNASFIFGLQLIIDMIMVVFFKAPTNGWIWLQEAVLCVFAIFISQYMYRFYFHKKDDEIKNKESKDLDTFFIVLVTIIIINVIYVIFCSFLQSYKVGLLTQADYEFMKSTQQTLSGGTLVQMACGLGNNVSKRIFNNNNNKTGESNNE